MKFATARERTLATGTYYASMLSLGFATAVVGPTLAGLAAQTGSSIGALGIVFTATSIGYLLGSLQSGRWFDGLPGHRLLAAAALVVAAALAGVTITTSLWPLTAAFLVLGAASATIDVGTNTLLLLIFRDRVGGVMNGLHFCFGAGALAAPAIVAGSIRASNDIAMAYLILAAVTLPVAAAFLAIPAAPRPGHARQRDTAPAPRGLIALIAAVFACYVAAEVGFGGWISTYALELGFGDAADTAYLASVFWGCLTLGRLIAVPLAGTHPREFADCDRFRRRTDVPDRNRVGARVKGDAMDRNGTVRVFSRVDLPDAAGVFRRADACVRPQHQLVHGGIEPRQHVTALAHRRRVRGTRACKPAVARRCGGGARRRAVLGRHASHPRYFALNTISRSFASIC